MYNRPFDDQRDIVVHSETEAKLVIQQLVKDKKLGLVWSDVLDYENNDNPYEERRIKIAEWETYASGRVELNDTIIEKAKVYMEAGLRQKDAAHIACAVYGGGDYFITVDRKILNKSIKEIIITDPQGFLRRMQDDD
jgi:predicted nucleic acid-binding protein